MSRPLPSDTTSVRVSAGIREGHRTWTQSPYYEGYVRVFILKMGDAVDDTVNYQLQWFESNARYD